MTRRNIEHRNGKVIVVMTETTRGNGDDKVREREIEDARAEGYARGVEQGSATARVRLALLADELRMMPSVWVDAYGLLAAGALSDGLEGRGVDSNPKVKPKVTRVRTKTSEVETRGLASRTKASTPQGGAEVRSLRLLSLKGRIDRRLRSLAREIQTELEGKKNAGAVRRCTRCKKFGEDTWNWCPYDGAAMESDDHR